MALTVKAIFVLFTFSLQTFPSTADKRSYFFNRIKTQSLGLVWNTSSTFTTASLSTCFLGCLSEDIISFAFDNDLKLCTCAATFTNEQNTTSHTFHVYSTYDESLLFSQCDPNLGFFLYVAGNMVVCIKLEETKATYNTARESCTGFINGRLFVMDTVQKMQLLIKIRQSAFTWIGLDDQLAEDVFVWSNGRNMTVEERDALFIGVEPNNSGGNEDCTALYLNDALNDAWCDVKFGYACEIPI